MTAEGPGWKTTDEMFKGKKVALFAVPGAFTGVCRKQHMPSIVANANAIKAKGVDTIAVTRSTTFRDAGLEARHRQKDQVEFLADGSADFAKAVGLDADLSAAAWASVRRYSMLVEDGVVKKLNVEEKPGNVEVSGGDALLGQL